MSLLLAGLTCKACSLDVLSPHEWAKKSTDALNNNLRPKSDLNVKTNESTY